MPYSEDLRERVLRHVDSGHSKMSAHKLFGISRMSIDRWLRLREKSGHFSANTHYRRGPRPRLNDLELFEAFVNRHPSCTLGQMAVAWEEETGEKLSVTPFSQALRRIGYTRKKRVFSTSSEKRHDAKSS